MCRGEVLLLGQLGLGEDVSGLLTGCGVDVEVLEEDLRVAGIGSAALVVVGTLDVDGRGHRGVRISEGCGLAVGTGDTVALRLGSLDDELQVGDVAGDVSQGEGHRRAGQCDGRSGRSLDAGEGRRSLHDLATTIDHPVVQPHEEVGAGDLGLGPEDGLALGRVGGGVPRQNLSVGQPLPSLGQLLEDSLHRRLIRGTRATTVAAITDVLTTARLSSGDTLCGARHFVEGN